MEILEKLSNSTYIIAIISAILSGLLIFINPKFFVVNKTKVTSKSDSFFLNMMPESKKLPIIIMMTTLLISLVSGYIAYYKGNRLILSAKENLDSATVQIKNSSYNIVQQSDSLNLQKDSAIRFFYKLPVGKLNKKNYSIELDSTIENKYKEIMQLEQENRKLSMEIKSIENKLYESQERYDQLKGIIKNREDKIILYDNGEKLEKSLRYSQNEIYELRRKIYELQKSRYIIEKEQLSQKKGVFLSDSTSHSLRVRDEPSINGNVLFLLQKGETFNIISPDSTWLKIKTMQGIGYVYRDYIKLIQ